MARFARRQQCHIDIVNAVADKGLQVFVNDSVSVNFRQTFKTSGNDKEVVEGACSRSSAGFWSCVISKAKLDWENRLKRLADSF